MPESPDLRLFPSPPNPVWSVAWWVDVARTLPPPIIFAALLTYMIIVLIPDIERRYQEQLEQQRREFIQSLKDQDVRGNEQLSIVEQRCYGMIVENNRILQELKSLLQQRQR